MKQTIPNQQKDWMGRGWAFPVQVDASTGGIAIAQYEIDIRQSIEIILGTSPGERVMRPDFGCGIRDLVYETINTALLTRIQTTVTDALVKYEPRIELLTIDIDPSDAGNGLLTIELEYRVRLTNQKDNLVYPFYFNEGGVAPAPGSRG
jgi:uncharacterized protein